MKQLDAEVADLEAGPERIRALGADGGGPIVAVDPGGTAPVSAVYLWLRRGSASERPEELGAAHLLEHMLFKGAGSHAAAEAATRIEGLGGDLNAFTSYEQTVLHATVPAGREEAAIETLAEMAFAPHLDPAELEREKGVVIEEIRGALDDPEDCLAEELRARAHAGHPYGRPILGVEETVRGLDAAALTRFHRTHLRPAHAILAVAGPVDADEIEAIASRHLLRWEGQDAVAPPARPERQTRPGPFVLGRAFEERLVELAWPIPGLGHPDIPALDLMATALGDGDSALLRVRLREQLDIAVDAWAMLESDVDGGLFVVGALARRGRTADVAVALRDAVAGLAVEGLPRAAMRRAQVGILSSRMVERETVDGRAYRLAWVLAQLGSSRAEALYEARVRALRSDAIPQVAGRWLDAGRAVIGAVAPRKELSESRLRRLLADTPAPGAGDADPRPASPPMVRSTLSCGLTLLVQPDPVADLAAVAVLGVGGIIAEGARRPGQAAAWAQAVTRGAGDLDATELSAMVEARAGGLRAWRARNSVGFEAVFPTDELDLGLAILSRVLCAPHFAEDELARIREDLVQARETLLSDDPGGLAWALGWQALFPGHAWGRPTLGTPASVDSLGSRTLRAFHRRCIAGENLVVAVVGDVDPAEIHRQLERSLSGLPKGAAVQPDPPTHEATFHRTRRRILDKEQTHLLIGFPAVGHGDPDSPAWRLLEGVLSGQSGRLFIELRERLGLAYSVDASCVEGLGGGAFMVTAAVDPARAEQARQGIWTVLASLVDQPVPDDELERVKTRVVDGAALGLQRASDRAGLLAAAERYADGAEHWRERLEAPRGVDAAQLQDLARRAFRRDRCVEVEVGPARATLKG